LEGELAGEIQSRLLSDLLYLSCARKYAAEGVLPIPTLEGPRGKTWAFVGSGLDDMRKMAEDHVHEVSFGPARDLRSTLLKGRTEYAGLIEAYVSMFITRSTKKLSSDEPFVGFLEHMRSKASQLVTTLGGASGLPASNSTEKFVQDADRLPEDPSSMIDKDLAERGAAWFLYFALIQEATRVSRANAYFTHALFGLSMRRLVKRFELARSLGNLPPASLTSLAWAKDVPTLSAAENETDCMLTAQFADFAAEFANSNDDTTALDVVLALSKEQIEAIRRQSEHLFGQGLRDEMEKVMDRAKKQSQNNDESVTPLEATTSLMLEAANAGELRMLSASPLAVEQLAWDAILYGAFLQDADEAISRELFAA